MILNRKPNLQIILYILIFVLQSCQYFEKKQSKEIMLKKELKNIDWNDVDEYPMIGNCDILDDKQQQKKCFFEFINQNIQKKLDSILIQKKTFAKDSILLQISVLPNSKIVYSFKKKDLELKNKINLDSVLQLPTLQFNNIKPALKRGIPVKIQFDIPVFI